LHQFDEEYNIPQQTPLATNVVALATVLQVVFKVT
jgi:hypothetical protein